MASPENAYEAERQQRIADNKRRMQELGVFEAKTDFERAVKACANGPKRIQRKERKQQPEGEIRRSGRARAQVDYREDNCTFHEKASRAASERRIVYMDRSDIDTSMFAAPKVRSSHDSGKGVRIQGGRVYDSKMGVTCHWCRQKTLENKVTCTSETCGGGRRLPTSFCKMCLRNRHGEDVQEAEASGTWICPCCRVSCGEGCQSCCNCGPCRRKAGLAPTHQIIKEARDSGFSNVHDYLIYQATGLDSESIAERKLAAPWGGFLTADARADPECSVSEAEPQEPCQKDPAALAQKIITDTMRAVKAVGGPAKKPEKGSGTDRKAERKMRVLRSMGLVAPPAVQTCA